MSNPKIRIPLTVSEQRQPVPMAVDQRQQQIPMQVSSGSGTRDYNKLVNRPRLNGILIEGDHDAAHYGIKSGPSFWFGTRAEYNALPEMDPAVCYCIEEGT